MQLSRMDLDEGGDDPRRIAEAILAQCPETPIPVPVEAIAYALDIQEIRVESLKSFEDALITTGPEKGEGSIVVNAENGLRRRRYTVGHELGHFLHPSHIPHTGKFQCTLDDMSRNSSDGTDKRARQEVQANAFATELLLPRQTFLHDLQRKGGLDLAHIIELGNDYDLSKEAVVRRCVSLQKDPCAVVFSRNGRGRYFCKHDDFPWLDIRPGNPMPRQSIAARGNGVVGQSSDWAEIDGGVWLSQARQCGVVEQTLLQQGGYRMTLLALDDEDGNHEEEDALMEIWTPRFR